MDDIVEKFVAAVDEAPPTTVRFLSHIIDGETTVMRLGRRHSPNVLVDPHHRLKRCGDGAVGSRRGAGFCKEI